MTKSKRNKRFLSCIEDNFVTQMIIKPIRAGALQTCYSQKWKNWQRMWKSAADLIVVTVEFKILKEKMSKANQITNLNFRAANFVMLQNLLG